MKYHEFRNRALESIRSVNAKLKRAILEDAQKYDLTDTQLFLMGFLKERGKANIGVIAAEFNTDCANISPMCKKMEARGLLKRERSKEDERVVNVTLTDFGEKIVKDVFGKLDRRFQAAFGNIEDGETDKILHYLNIFANCFLEKTEE